MVLHEKYKNVGQMLTWNDIVVIKMSKEIMNYNKKSMGKLNLLVAIVISSINKENQYQWAIVLITYSLLR